MDTVADFKEIVEEIEAKGGEAFKRCFQCGLCDAVCPWNRLIDFSMRRLVRQAVFGMTDIESGDIWRCTTCGRCPQQCPRDVRQIDSGLSLRRVATEYDVFPDAVKPLRSISVHLTDEGNPMGEDREQRADWASGLDVRSFSEEMEVLYFPGCYLSYDPRMKKVARATAGILNRAGVNYGILGSRENCCGESIRKTGNEGLFRRLARENIKTFIDEGVKRIVVSSPHCYHTFKNEYPEFMVHFDVVHISQLISELIDQGRLALSGEFARKVTYHDPCYLGRHNGVYDQPRSILQGIAGLELIEMPESRGRSLCCGGGGGRIWVETAKGERFSDLRVRQAIDLGAKVLATACPYCISNFEDSRLALEDETALEIRDITEIVFEAIQKTDATG
ncbi:MAG: (Fe-S)-binding protein [Desulfocapsaceae bacterium]|nr:(Fe-S)-binding protein [Desulfocapsaceae bacterium]